MLDVKKGDFMLSREDSLMSRFIQYMTKSPWSHVSICVSPMHYVSAVPFKGVCVRRIDEVEQRAGYRLVDATSEQLDGMCEFCLARMGAPYDFMQVLYLGWRLLMGTITTATGDPNPGKFMCSELVSEACASQGIFFGRIVDNVMPGQIASSPLTTKVWE